MRATGPCHSIFLGFTSREQCPHLCQQDGVGGLHYMLGLCFSSLLEERLFGFQQPLGVMKRGY